MVKYLTQHGNSMALVIDKPILELLHISKKTPLQIETDGSNLIVSPAPDAKREKKFKAAMAHVFATHDKTFRKLAQFKKSSQ